MTRKKLILTGAALGLAAVTAQAQAQSTQDLQRALAQAQAAAAQAQDAALKAQAALEQVQAAAADAKKSSATAAAAAAPAGSNGVTAQVVPGSGLMVRSGDSYGQLYGLIDATLFSKNHADKSGNKVFSPDVAWFSGNRWGITGRHSTGGPGSLAVIFRLESEFESQTGNMDTPGVLFNRDSWLGLESKSLGKLTFGRQNALPRDPAASAVYGDPYGPQKAGLDEGGYSNNNNFKQLIFYAGSATGTRYDRGVVWKKDWGSLISGLAYQFGGVPGSFGTNTTESASLAYNGPGFTVAGFLTRADVNSFKHQTQSIGGNVQVSPLIRVNAGYFHYTAEQPVAVGNRHDSAWTLSTKITPPGVFDYELGYQIMSANNAGVNGSGFVKNAYADTSTVTGVATGKRKTLYGSIFYHLDKQTEFYLAADHLTTTDTYKAAQANGYMSQSEVGLGMRYKF
ncbi:MAG TPA: porin [Ramlibacter sp.]|jgi:predicted porin|nr:porin [Ramlibacter sp.]